MPASMIIALVGSRPYVIGSSKATVMAGPMPGSTPTAVPTTTPISASSRFIGVAAVAKPSTRNWRFSMSSNPPLQNSLEDAGRQADPQTDGKAVERGQAHDDGDGEVADEVPTAERDRGAVEQQRARDHPAEQVDQQNVRDE